VETLKDKKLELQYPCTWCYKVIGTEQKAMQNAIHEVILEREHTLTHSNNSKSGKYISLNLELLVHNDDDRNFIYDAIKNHKNIKMVL